MHGMTQLIPTKLLKGLTLLWGQKAGLSADWCVCVEKKTRGGGDIAVPTPAGLVPRCPQIPGFKLKEDVFFYSIFTSLFLVHAYTVYESILILTKHC